MVFLLFYLVSVCSAHLPLSKLDPQGDMGFFGVLRSGKDSAPVDTLWSPLLRKQALPTNAWWQNAVLGDGDSESSNIPANPYILQPAATGLKVTLPWALADSDTSFINSFDFTVFSVMLSAKEDIKGNHKVNDYSSLTVDLQWDFEGGNMLTHLSRGNPYITVYYDNVTPVFQTPQVINSLSVNGIDQSKNVVNSGKSLKVSKVSLSFIQSDFTWNVYFSSPLDVFFSSEGGLFSITPNNTWTGAIRTAVANNCTTGSNLNFCDTKGSPNPSDFDKVLDFHADSVIIAGDIKYSSKVSKSSGMTTKVSYNWISKPFYEDAGPRDIPDPIVFALPHHVDLLLNSSAKVFTQYSHTNIKGTSSLVSGSSWDLVYQYPSLDFDARLPIDPSKIDHLRDSLENEELDLPVNFANGASDPYFAGKVCARMAKLALIANQLDDTEKVNLILEKIKGPVELWISQQSNNPLLFDTTWKGIVSCGCDFDDCSGTCSPRCKNTFNRTQDQWSCPALNGPLVDFGNAYYNDHHFQYGYFILSAAVIGKFDREWLNSQLENVLLLVRDIANPSRDDVFFPQYRLMDWYAGHSWTLGIPLAGSAPFRNGKNQESSSEAVNAWYGVYLLGLSSERQDLTDLGLALLSSEIYTVQHYWQIQQNSKIYPARYKKNHVMGIIWEHLAQFGTYFSSQTWAIHGIQVLPVTAASEILLDKQWVSEAHADFALACSNDPTCTSDGWISFVLMELAILDPEDAWNKAVALDRSTFSFSKPGSNGNSFTNMLYFIATRGNTLPQVI